MTVANRLNHTPLLINEGIFLDPGTGDLIAHTGRSAAIDVIPEGATATGWYGFALPDGTELDDPALVLGEPGHRRERLPLTGRVPEPEYPKPIEVASPGTVHTRDGCPLEVAVAEAYLAHSVGFDHDGRSHTTEQAGADRLMLYLGLAVTAPPGSVACFIDTSGGGDVHLVVDGVRLGDIPELEGTGSSPTVWTRTSRSWSRRHSNLHSSRNRSRTRRSWLQFSASTLIATRASRESSRQSQTVANDPTPSRRSTRYGPIVPGVCTAAPYRRPATGHAGRQPPARGCLRSAVV